MNDELISVIVPAYNVRNFIDDCVASIVKQTYKRLEVILVDDGSTDGTSEVCDAWCKKDARCYVVHKDNGGLSDARNVGIDKSHGNFLVFVDADDYIDKEYIEKLHNALSEDKDADISMCGFYTVYNNKMKKHIIDNAAALSGKMLLKKAFSNDTWGDVVVVWNKMYRRDTFKGLRFDNGRLHEDEFFTDKVLYRTKKVVLIRDVLYFYRKNADSITSQNSVKRIIDCIDAFLERINFFKANDEVLFVLAVRQCFDAFLRLLATCRENENASKKVTSAIRKEYSRKQYFNFLTSKQKVKYMILWIFPGIMAVWVNRNMRKVENV